MIQKDVVFAIVCAGLVWLSDRFTSWMSGSTQWGDIVAFAIAFLLFWGCVGDED